MLAGQATAAAWLREPELSPDGQWLAFRADGDLFVASVATGKARLLRGTVAHERSPIWLPDGRGIAFASNASGNFDVFTIDVAGKGEPTQLTWHSRDELPVGVAMDGQSLLIRSGRGDLSAGFANYPLQIGAREDRRVWQPWTGIFLLPIHGGMPQSLIESNSSEATWDATGERLLISVAPSTENIFRKHDRSPATWDLWTSDPAGGNPRKLTAFEGHDTTPRWNAVDGRIYFLSERSGSFNVWSMSPRGDADAQPLTSHDRDPVRGLSISKNGRIAYSFQGGLYVGDPQEGFRKLAIRMPARAERSADAPRDLSAEVRQAIRVPGRPEVVVVARGEAYVIDPASGRRRTLFAAMPGVKSWPSFSADGRRLLAVRDRGDSSDLLLAQLPDGTSSWLASGGEVRATVLAPMRAEVIVRAALSPDGTRAVFTTGTSLRVIDTSSKAVRELLTAAEGLDKFDQPIVWHPDSVHLAIAYRTLKRTTSDIAVLSTHDGSLLNVTRSGFDDRDPQWSADGRKLYWLSDRDGLRAFNSLSGSTADSYALDLTGSIEALRAEPDRLDGQRVRLTATSGSVLATAFAPSGRFFLQLRDVGGRSELWRFSPPMGQAGGDEQKVMRVPEAPLRGERPIGVDAKAISIPSLEIAADERDVLLVVKGTAYRVDLDSGAVVALGLDGVPREHIAEAHRWLFEHVVRTIERVYYRPEFLPQIRWPEYVSAYRLLAAGVRDPLEFAELMNELLGELQGSHTYFEYEPQFKRTRSGSLGVIYDTAHDGAGWRIAEVLPGSPLAGAAREGEVIAQVNDTLVAARTDPAKLLRETVGKSLTLRILSEGAKDREIQAVPVGNSAEGTSLYQRWVAWQRRETERLSHGRLGYVHMASMTEQPFRDLVDDVLGRFVDKQGIVFDTRFNQGGWMHEPLMSFFSAPHLFDLKSVGRIYASEPALRAGRPTIVLVNAANYSNGSEVPRLFQEHRVAKLVGEAYAGTGLGGHSDPLPFPEYRYGVAHDTCLTADGHYWENVMQQPDFPVASDRSMLRVGRDPQLEAAVEALLKP